MRQPLGEPSVSGAEIPVNMPSNPPTIVFEPSMLPSAALWTIIFTEEWVGAPVHTLDTNALEDIFRNCNGSIMIPRVGQKEDECRV